MTNVKEFHCHMRMNLQPYEENRIYLALFHGTGETVQLGPSEESKTSSTKWTLQTLYIYSQLQKKQEKTVLSILF